MLSRLELRSGIERCFFLFPHSFKWEGKKRPLACLFAFSLPPSLPSYLCSLLLLLLHKLLSILLLLLSPPLLSSIGLFKSFFRERHKRSRRTKNSFFPRSFSFLPSFLPSSVYLPSRQASLSSGELLKTLPSPPLPIAFQLTNDFFPPPVRKESALSEKRAKELEWRRRRRRGRKKGSIQVRTRRQRRKKKLESIASSSSSSFPLFLSKGNSLVSFFAIPPLQWSAAAEAAATGDLTFPPFFLFSRSSHNLPIQ